MKRLAVLLTAMAMFGTSLANTNYSGNLENPTTAPTPLPAKTAIKKESVRAKVPRIPKPKVFRSNPFRAAYFAANPDKVNDIDIDDDDKISGYRKRDLQKIRAESTPDDPEGSVTDDIKWKLFLARQAALIAYKQKWG